MTKHRHVVWQNQNFLNNLPKHLPFQTAEFYFWSFDLTGIQHPGNLFAEVIFCIGQSTTITTAPSATLTVNNVLAVSAGFYPPVGMNDAIPWANINPEFSLADLAPSSTAQVKVTTGQAVLNSMDITLVQTAGQQAPEIVLMATPTPTGIRGVFDSTAATPPIYGAVGTWVQKNQWHGTFPSPFIIAQFFPQPVRGEFPE